MRLGGIVTIKGMKGYMGVGQNWWEKGVNFQWESSGVKYPICVKGKRASPPEDCGGVWGYEDLVKIIADPNHKEHEKMMGWTGGDFDPEYFDVKDVCFDDPKKRLKMAFE